MKKKYDKKQQTVLQVPNLNHAHTDRCGVKIIKQWCNSTHIC